MESITIYTTPHTLTIPTTNPTDAVTKDPQTICIFFFAFVCLCDWFLSLQFCVYILIDFYIHK